MKKKLLRWCLPALVFSLLLLGCRNEDFTGQYVNSKREEVFFREALSKTSRLRNNKTIIDALKKQNERSHFVSRMKDQSGLPMWDKVQTIRKSKTTNKGESGDGTEGYIIPLTENEKTLSSILFVTKESDDSYLIKDIDNERLKQDIFNTQIDKAVREQMLLDFVLTDYLSFSRDAIYWNIPDDLLSFIPKDPNHPQRRFQIRVPALGSGGGVSDLNDSPMCISWVTNCTCPASWGGCDHCNNEGQCMDHEICGVSGYGDGGYYGGDGGGDGDGGYTGPNTGGENGGGSDGGGGTGNPNDPGGNGGTTDCNSPNKAFYKIVPGCDDGGDGDNGYLDTPCNKINTIFADAKFTEKYNELDKPENFNLDREKAFIMRYPPKGVNIPPSYFQVDMPPCATGSEDAVMPSNNAGLAGLMHTHTNSTCNGGYPIKVPSPVDIKYLLNTLLSQANQYTGSYSNAYSITITSGGSYMLMYTGTNYPGSLNDDAVKQLKKDYTDKFQELYTYKDNNVTQADIEKVFTKFMKEKINKPGLEVYRVTPTSAVKIEYDPASPNSVKETPCP